MNNISYVILASYPDRGMKSYGSKSLMIFNNEKLLQYQINTINLFNKKNTDYEIMVISDFDKTKLQKAFQDIKIIDSNIYNPIYAACYGTKYDNIVFIDYGCVFNTKILSTLNLNNSSILCQKESRDISLDIGCIVDKEHKVLNMFIDLPENKFCNIFYIQKKDTHKILQKDNYKTKNLLYFEIINMLINDNSIFTVNYINNNNFIYFNNLRQKNAISKFIRQ